MKRSYAYSLRESSERDRPGGVFGTTGKSLPKLLGNEGHEGVEKTKSSVETGVESLLSGESDLGGGGLVGHRLGSLLRKQEKRREERDASDRVFGRLREREIRTMKTSQSS